MRILKWIFVLFISVLCFTASAQDKVGSEAPDFSGKTIDGKDIKLSDYKGKVVLIDFWASWCVPCREEMPELIKFYREHNSKDFELIAINIDNDQKNMQHFLDELFPKPSFPVVEDNTQQIPSLFDIQAMPTTIFVDKAGKVRFIHNGFKNLMLMILVQN